MLREVDPTVVLTERSLAQRLGAVPERSQLELLVAVDGDGVVGRVEALLDWFVESGEKAICNVAVATTHRQRGLGTELAVTGLAHVERLGARQVITQFAESADGVRFATRHGFREGRAEAVAVLDPRSVAEEPPSGLDLRPIAEVDPHAVHRLDMEATRDMPFTGTIAAFPFDEWRRLVLDHALFAPEGSFVAFIDGEPAALSLLTADPESGRASNMFTGTLPAFRGRGLALAVKLASTRWAAANGIVQIETANDETNAPMLAVNRRLGYHPAGRHLEMVRER